ncbi:MAG: hypothetical protein FJ271_04535 [Planctomycetes bacterium]|nr:hypothetical protein [Planctomycetota bacterium]
MKICSSVGGTNPAVFFDVKVAAGQAAYVLSSDSTTIRYFGRIMLLGSSRLLLFALLLSAGVCVGCVGLVAMAFERFDVARDRAPNPHERAIR